MNKQRNILRLCVVYQLATKDRQPDFQSKSSSEGEKESSAVVGVLKKRLALVDDDLFVRSMFETVLASHGFDIVASMSDGSEIVESIDKMDPMPDIILLDERMPRMSGVEACKIIHAKHPLISIVFVTADESVTQRAKEAGARAFLFKPVSFSQLISLINSL